MELGISKNELKRRKKKEEREANKKEWRAKLREKRKEKRSQQKESSRCDKQHVLPMEKRMMLFPETTIVLDTSFDDYMLDKERQSLYTQISRCYGMNRRSLKPVQVIVGPLSDHQELSMNDSVSISNWKDPHFHIEKRHWKEVFPIEKLVYLTADSDSVLDTFDLDKVYIIGCIVDKNRHKGITLKAAKEADITTARLPIREHASLLSSSVLTVNQVFELIMAWINLKDWREAILSVIPSRKLKQ